jgi:ribonuclease BN (tRNA processing enzyme)
MPIDSIVRSRRSLLRGVFRIVGFSAVIRILPFGIADPGVFAQSEKEADKKENEGSTLILLGTQGGPAVSLTRSQTASLLLVGNRQYLVDCGYGTLRALIRAGVGFNNLSTIFLTHLHNDHTSDLASLLSFKWTSGRARETNVYGPYGTAELVKAAIAFFKADTEIRIVNEGRTVRPETLFHEHDLKVSGVTEVFRDDRVVVKSVENTHFPERDKKKMPYRSLAYRFDMADRSIVFSGDTSYSAGLVALAHNADVFVCETIGTLRRRQRNEAAKATADNKESIGRHVFETHSTTEDVGRMAAEANVKAVVLNHLVGGGNTGNALESFESGLVESVHQYFPGKIIVGRDQMRI